MTWTMAHLKLANDIIKNENVEDWYMKRLRVIVYYLLSRLTR